MENQFEIELAMAAKIKFSHKKGSHQIKVETIDPRTGMDDSIHLNHNEKLRLIQWLVNSIEV